MPRVLQVLSSLQTGGGVQVMLKNYYAQLAPLAFQTDFVVCGALPGGTGRFTGPRAEIIAGQDRRIL